MEISWVINYNAALITNIIAIVLLWRKYQVASLLHPFNYYLATWILSLLSFGVAISVGLDSFLISDEKLLSQLMFTIAFVGGVISLVLFKAKKPAFRGTLNWYIPHRIIKIIGYIILILGLFLIATKGFDVATNRFSSLDSNRTEALEGQRQGVLGVIIGVFFFLKMPLLIYNGCQFYKMIVIKVEPLKFDIFFVLAGSILETIASGGRSAIVSSLSYFFIGIILNHIKSRQTVSNFTFIKKIIVLAIVPVLLLSTYINFVAQERTKKQGSSSVTSELLSKSYLGEHFYGVMEYSIFHYLGYQLRMNDSATEDLELGQYTFQVITTYNLPIVSQVLRSEINLATLLDLKKIDNNIANENSKSIDLANAGITSTVFYVLYDDFGFYGSLAVIVLFIFFTQNIFNKLLTSDIRGFYSIVLWVFIFDLWKYTWFSHHLNGPIFNSYLYAAVVLFLLNKKIN